MSARPHRWSPRARLSHWNRRRLERNDHSTPGRLYAGHRGDHARVYVVTRMGVSALPPAARHATDYDWGADGPEAFALAHALLTDLTGGHVPTGLVAALAAGPVAELPHDGFVLDAHDLWRWLAHTRPAGAGAWTPLRPGG